MFDDVKREDNPQAGNSPAMDDMFSDTDPVRDKEPVGMSAVQSGKIRPVTGPVPVPQQPSQPAKTVGPQQPLRDLREANNWESESKGSGLRKIFSILVVVVSIAAVGIGGWFVYINFIQPSLNQADNQNTNTNTNTNPSSNININRDSGVEPVAPVKIDKDDDGLTDVEETTLGTDPENPDTDKDGLTDREEAKIYNTDPLNTDTDNDGLNDREEVFVYKTSPTNPDTDGDTYLDGEEVQNGYSPIGPGRLVPEESLPTI